MREIRFIDIGGIKVGHAQDLKAATGCTVIIREQGATVGVDVRGGAPGTRETDLLNPTNSIEKVHAILLAGGSAFGLDAAAGIMKYLEERNIGFDMGVTRVPIVCGAVLFDLAIGDYRVRPDKEMGYEACLNATENEAGQGNIGAGAGATVGKILGMKRAMKGGLGSYCLQVEGLKIGAIVAVNCLGHILDPFNGKILAGPLSEDMNNPLDSEEIMTESYSQRGPFLGANTTIGVVVTNAVLTKSQATKVASMAHNGYARTIRPTHSMFDGDTIFVMATGNVHADLTVIGLLAARVVEGAILSAIRSAKSLCGFKPHADLEFRE